MTWGPHLQRIAGRSVSMTLDLEEFFLSSSPRLVGSKVSEAYESPKTLFQIWEMERKEVLALKQQKTISLTLATL